MSTQNKSFSNNSVADLVAQMFDDKNFMTHATTNYGRYLSASANFRGKVASSEVEKLMQRLKSKNRYPVFPISFYSSATCL